MRRVVFTKQAAKDAKKLKAAGLDKKAKSLADAVRENPFKTPPAYDALVDNLSGLYSRRISFQHRFVYEAVNEPVAIGGTDYEGTVKVIHMWTHYERI